MRSKSQYSISLKLILFCLFLVFLLFLVLRSGFSSSSLQSASPILGSAKASSSKSSLDDDQDRQQSTATNCQQPAAVHSTPTCTKISTSLAQAIVHYAATNVTPQQTLKEISVTLRVLEKKSPCNLLVFGLGRDSLMWTSLNHGGRTLFLEEDKLWIDQIQKQFPTLESYHYHVTYDTKVTDSDQLLEIGTGKDCKAVGDPRSSKCRLAHKGFPNEVYDTEWDLIMVDAPTGYHDGAPGRMSAIYTAGLMARNREAGETDVFVHDVDRSVEDKFSKSFLCEGYLTEQEGKLRHFTVPSHRTRQGRPFCP